MRSLTYTDPGEPAVGFGTLAGDLTHSGGPDGWVDLDDFLPTRPGAARARDAAAAGGSRTGSPFGSASGAAAAFPCRRGASPGPAPT